MKYDLQFEVDLRQAIYNICSYLDMEFASPSGWKQLAQKVEDDEACVIFLPNVEAYSRWVRDYEVGRPVRYDRELRDWVRLPNPVPAPNGDTPIWEYLTTNVGGDRLYRSVFVPESHPNLGEYLLTYSNEDYEVCDLYLNKGSLCINYKRGAYLDGGVLPGFYLKTFRYLFGVHEEHGITPLSMKCLPHNVEWNPTNVEGMWIAHSDSVPCCAKPEDTPGDVSDKMYRSEGKKQRVGGHTRVFRMMSYLDALPDSFKMWAAMYGNWKSSITMEQAKMLDNYFPGAIKDAALFKLLGQMGKMSLEDRVIRGDSDIDMFLTKCLGGYSPYREITPMKRKDVFKCFKAIKTFSHKMPRKYFYYTLAEDHNLRNRVIKEANSFDYLIIGIIDHVCDNGTPAAAYLMNCYMRDRSGFKAAFKTLFPKHDGIPYRYTGGNMGNFWSDLKDYVCRGGHDFTRFSGIRNLVERSREWHEEYSRKIHSDEKIEFISPIIPGNSHITYIDNSHSLQAEGKKMHHCVASYTNLCALGSSYIYHVDLEGEEATLELGDRGQLKQLRGPCNAQVSDDMKKVVNTWMLNNTPAREIVKGKEDMPLIFAPGDDWNEEDVFLDA